MFGLHLWARPFLHPSPAAGAGGSVDTPTSAMARPPAGGFGAPGYLLPHLAGDKSSAAAGTMPFNPSSLFLYRPGEHYIHPSLLRLNMGDPAGLHLPHPGATERALHPHLFQHGNEEGETYPSAFQPTKRPRVDDGGPGLHSRPDSGHSHSKAERYSRDGSPPPTLSAGRYPLSSPGKQSPSGGHDGRSSTGARSPDSTRRPDTADHLSDHDRGSYGE